MKKSARPWTPLVGVTDLIGRFMILMEVFRARLASRFSGLRPTTFEYAVHEGRSLQLDLYLPSSGETCPLIIYFHAGAWRAGSRKDVERGVLAQVKRGYAVASVSYSLSDKAKWPAQLHEAKAAVRWLRAHAGEHGLDPDRFIAWGLSAGGHMAAMLGVSEGVAELEGELGSNEESSRVQAVVSWCGPSDFLQMGRGKIINHDSPKSPESRLIGGPIQDLPERVRLANPIAYVHSNVPPCYLAHGDADLLVPYQQSEILHDALREAGVSVELEIQKGYGHGDPRFNTGRRIKGVQSFLERYLMAPATVSRRSRFSTTRSLKARKNSSSLVAKPSIVERS